MKLSRLTAPFVKTSGEKCRSLFPTSQADILKIFILVLTNSQPENIIILKLKVWDFFLKNDSVPLVVLFNHHQSTKVKLWIL